MHRVALRTTGVEISASESRPVIGIANSASGLNPCNLPLAALSRDVARGIRDAGGIPMEFPVMSLGEDLMKPTAMLYRNLLAMEVEEYLRSYPLDGVVLLANCDKSVPGAVMGAVSAGLPTVVLTAGARPIARFRGRRVGTGTELWRTWEDHRAGRLDDAGWSEFEECLSCGLGACNTMGTASSMAIVTEALGLALPGTSTIPAADESRVDAAYETGRRAVSMVLEDFRPEKVLTPDGFKNAARVLNAIGGSTNVVLHLLAIAGRAGVEFRADDVDRFGRGVPVLADVEPSGRLLIQDFHDAGGLPQLLARLGSLIETSALTATGRPWASEIPPPSGVGDGAIRSLSNPLSVDGAFAVVRGSLAPHGAILKTSAASGALFQHVGPALVFRSYEEMRSRIDDPGLDVSPDTVLVLSGAGPVGVPGMPEWGMIPIPAKLAALGVSDMVRITDSRMSGTSFGTCLLHVAPEAAVGGPIGLVRDGDMVSLDVAGRHLDLLVDSAEMQARAARWSPSASAHLRGWPALYRNHVTQADQGCDLDFLQAPTPAHRRFVPPTVGRS